MPRTPFLAFWLQPLSAFGWSIMTALRSRVPFC